MEMQCDQLPVAQVSVAWREVRSQCESKVSCPRTQHNCPRPGLKPGPLDPETSALTMRPPRLPIRPIA